MNTVTCWSFGEKVELRLIDTTFPCDGQFPALYIYNLHEHGYVIHS